MDAVEAQREALSGQFARLLHPVTVGSTVAGATVMSLRVDEWGTGEVRLSSAAGAFRVDVCTKEDDAAHAPMSATRDYALFVRNGGTGSKKTDEVIASAVSSLASTLASNEQTSERVSLVTKSQYWTADFWQRS